MRFLFLIIPVVFFIAGCEGEKISSDRRKQEGTCYQAAAVKVNRSGMHSLDESLRQWLIPNFDAQNRINALANSGGKCAGASDDCFKKNLSQSDYDFAKGMAIARDILEEPQDPNGFSNLAKAMFFCAGLY
jgi:hypothetical protein